MLSGHEFKIADEIHRERLRQADRRRLYAMVTGNPPVRTARWENSVRNRLQRLALLWKEGAR